MPALPREQKSGFARLEFRISSVLVADNGDGIKDITGTVLKDGEVVASGVSLQQLNNNWTLPAGSEIAANGKIRFEHLV